MKSEFELQALC